MMNSADEQSDARYSTEEFEDVSAPLSLARAVHARRGEYVRKHRTRIKIGTWNIAGCLDTESDLKSWFVEGKGVGENLASLNLSENSAAKHEPTSHKDDGDAEPIQLVGGSDIGIYVLGLQEVVDLNGPQEYMNRAVYTDDTTKAKWKDALEAAMPSGYELVASEQLIGILLLIYAAPDIANTITNVSTKQVGTGFLGFGNKGAVTTRILLGETTRLVFINCHLASGIGPAAMDRRCWDVAHIATKTQFDPIVIAGVEEDDGDKIGDEDFAFWFGDLNFRVDGLPGDDIRRLLTLHAKGEYGYGGTKPGSPTEESDSIVMKNSDSDDETAVTTTPSIHSRQESMDSEVTLPDPDDFPEDPSQDPTSLQATLDSLLPHDQLRKVIRQRKAFHEGWREGAVKFLPTYKYDVGSVGLFDSSEKQRAPSWCDRILYRTRKGKQDYDAKIKEEEETKKKDEEMKSRGLEEDDDVLFSYDPEADGEDQSKPFEEYGYDEYDEVGGMEDDDVVTNSGFHDKIHLELYTSYQHVTSSDHKPICSVFTLEYDAVVPELKAKVHGEVARQLDRAENEGRPGITVIVEGGDSREENLLDFGDVTPTEKKSSSLMIANTGGADATLLFVEKPTAEEGDDTLPNWLQTTFFSNEVNSTKSLGKSVTLEPGETLIAHIEIQISSPTHIRALNEGHAKLDDVLVLRVENGRDHFLLVRGTWLPTCLGRSIPELIRVPDGGIRKFVKEKEIKGAIPYDMPVQCSAPKELFKLTEITQTLVERCIADAMMLEDAGLPRDPGWPFDMRSWTSDPEDLGRIKVAIIQALDEDKPLMEAFTVEAKAVHKLEALISVLLLFLESLTDGLIPAHVWAKIMTALPNLTSTPPQSWPDVKTQILDVLSTAPNHNIAFVFLAATLSRTASELSPVTNAASSGRPGMVAGGALVRRLSFRKGGNPQGEDVQKRMLRDKRFAELVGPLVIRTGDGGRVGRERFVLEMFLRRDEGH